MSERPILIISGIGHHKGLVSAIRALSSVAAVVVIEAAEEIKETKAAFVRLREASSLCAAAISRLKDVHAESSYRRERDYPTLREGIRRKAITKLRKGRR